MRVFLAAPFTDRIEADTGRVPDSYRQWIESLATILRGLGHDVVCAHERENWGAKLDPPEVALRLDWEEIERCDLLVAYVGEPPSPGVQMEIGFASAYRKPVILLSNSRASLPYLARGLGEVTETVHVRVEESADAGAVLTRALGTLSVHTRGNQ